MPSKPELPDAFNQPAVPTPPAQNGALPPSQTSAGIAGTPPPAHTTAQQAAAQASSAAPKTPASPVQTGTDPSAIRPALSVAELLRASDVRAEQVTVGETYLDDLPGTSDLDDTLGFAPPLPARPAAGSEAYQQAVEAARAAARAAAMRQVAREKEQQQRADAPGHASAEAQAPAAESTAENTAPVPEAPAGAPAAEKPPQRKKHRKAKPAKQPKQTPKQEAKQAAKQQRRQKRRQLRAKRRAARLDRPLRQPGKLWRGITRNPVAKATGQLLYLLGFYAQCKLLMVWRVVRNVLVFLGQMLGMMFGGFFRSLGAMLRGLGRDLTAPFRRLGSGFANMRATVRTAKQEGKGRSGTLAMRYVGSGIKNYGHLLGRLVGALLPLTALALAVIIVSGIVRMEYALAVEVDGQVIGYVANELVLEDAKAILRTRMKVADDQNLEDWQFSPTLAVGATSHVMGNRELANSILEDSDAEIVQGTGLFIDGELYAVTTEGARLRQYLDDKLAQSADPERPDATISFVQDVECQVNEEDLFFASSVRSYDDIVTQLESNASEAEYYTAGGEESLAQIAERYELVTDALRTRNPAFANSRDTAVPEAGTQLLVKPARPFLQVQLAVRQASEVEVPYREIRENTSALVQGSIKVLERGQVGRKRVYEDLIYIDGELVSRQRISELDETITPVRDQVTLVGTTPPSSVSPGSGVSTGNYIWPVPAWKYSSRGASSYHRGRDINAATGADILAMDGGTVVVAEFHYSWGNYIRIDHGNGVQTLYAHCSELYVEVGARVSQGQTIAAVGSTGNSSGPHLHIEVWLGGSWVDPDPYLDWPR